MDIILYYNKSEKNKIDKDIEEIISLAGNFRDSVSILKPRIVIELDYLIDFNYIYIEHVHRYYFVNNIVCIRNNIYLIECSVDVLMSYKNDIMKQSAFVERSVNVYDTNIVDNKFINNVKKEIFDDLIIPNSNDGEIRFRSYGLGEGDTINCVLSLISEARLV